MSLGLRHRSRRETAHSLVQTNAGAEAEQIMRPGGTGEQMARRPRAVSADHRGPKPTVSGDTQRRCRLEEGGRAPGANVEDDVVGYLGLEGENVGAGGVGHMDEIAALAAVFEHLWADAILDLAAELTGDADERRVARHQRPVQVVIAQGRHSGAWVLDGVRLEQHLLVYASDAREPSRADRGVFCEEPSNEFGTADGAAGLEPTGVEVFGSPRLGDDSPMIGAVVDPVAVYRRGAASNDASSESHVVKGRQQGGGAEIVLSHVRKKIGKTIAASGAKRLVRNGVDAADGSTDLVDIVDIGPQPLDVDAERCTEGVNGVWGIEPDDLVTALAEQLNDVSTDKSGCTGDQHTHDRSFLGVGPLRRLGYVG